MSLFRKIIFYAFVLIYLVFCPLIILYAFGVVVKPGTGRGIVKTGLIYLSTVPASAAVYIGQSRFSQKTPTVIRDLVPGDYSVTLVSQGRRVWTETVPVEAEKASVLERILLLPDRLRTEEIAAGPYRNLAAVPGTEFILLFRTKNAGQAQVYDWKKNLLRPLFSEDDPSAGGRIDVVYTVRDSSKVLAAVDTPDRRIYAWVDLRRPSAAAEDLTPLFQSDPKRVRWDPDNDQYVYVLQDGAVDQLNVRTKSLRPRLIGSVAGFGTYRDDLYVLKSDHTFGRYNDEGKGLQVYLKDPAVGSALFAGKGQFDIRVLGSQLMIFQGEDGEFILNRLPYRFVPQGVAGFEYQKKPEKILVWRKDKIGVLDLSEERLQEDAVFETAPRVAWLYEDGKNIAQAYWVYEGSHILFRDGTGVHLIDEETYGAPRVHRLLDVKEEASVYYSEDSGRLYYLKPGTGAFCSAEILPKQEVISLPFPERREKTKQRKSVAHGISLFAPFTRSESETPAKNP